ncbi:helix-turn-helix domain-containing protein [Hoeflea sp. TYP-13]|uniref:helix-turn-helix domain-containing protein n=1 Tax=Hoeflea sp. TYP-13 TaxID=3230023 RepID=UPI0034C5E374
MSDLLTPEAAATRLGISTKQLLSLTRLGKIRYINVGLGGKRETRRYDESDLEAFIEAGKQVQWPSKSARTGKRTGTTSNIVDVDFLETRTRQLKEKRKQ